MPRNRLRNMSRKNLRMLRRSLTRAIGSSAEENQARKMSDICDDK
jgi:hypothetical protein